MSQFEEDDQSNGHHFFPVYHSLENKEFSDDEQEPVIFVNYPDEEPEVSPGEIEEPKESLSPSVAKTVGIK